jgi:hypothetical protein
VYSGQTAAHGHSGSLGRGPARWPKTVAFDSPCQWSTAKAHPERALRIGTRSPRLGSKHGAVHNGMIERHEQQGLLQSHPRYSGCMLLHQDLDEVARKVVLTSEAIGAATTDGVEGGNDS